MNDKQREGWRQRKQNVGKKKKGMAPEDRRENEGEEMEV